MSENTSSGLVNKAILDKIDRLRELNVPSIALPQLVVVGDQSSGKSSVLESLTGFSFPQAPGLCTRYATQISCRRTPAKSVSISIIPKQGTNAPSGQKLRDFKHCIEDLTSDALATAIEKANKAMGIRSTAEDTTTGLQTFSAHILKIEVCGPDQEHLTVIDVPGIFRVPTPPFTTNNDVTLVKDMVESYMKDARTITLAVIPSNVDISTQEVLKMAEEADPDGSRTMGVLTKPDLVTENATQEVLNELLLGKRHRLRLGYFVVKNRNADDQTSTVKERLDQETVFFEKTLWKQVKRTQRCGIPALRAKLSNLLMELTKKEFPHVKSDLTKSLHEKTEQLRDIGPSRKEVNAQRLYLIKLSSQFQNITQNALNGYYNGQQIFSENQNLKLITIIVDLNEKFANNFWQKGHKRETAQNSTNEGEVSYASSENEIVDSMEVYRHLYPELADIIVEKEYECPEPLLFSSGSSILDNIDEIYRLSRGPELGTFSGSILATTFREQSEKWEPMVLSHVSKAIAVVHDYASDVLRIVCPDQTVRTQLWNDILLEKFRVAYVRALEHARFLLNIERNRKPTTYNHYFNMELQRRRNERFTSAVTKDARVMYSSNDKYAATYSGVLVSALKDQLVNKDNTQQVCEDILDILVSYYKVARKRFVDVICMQVIDHHLLEGDQSPLKIFTPELMMELDTVQLEGVAGEKLETRELRSRLEAEIESLQKATEVLRG